MARNVRRRGVSPVIASLLLIAIAVAAAVVTYSWVMTMISTQGRQAQTSIRIDEVLFGQDPADNTKQGIKVTIRNTGSVVAVIDAIYVYKGSDLVVKAEFTTDNAVSAGEVKEFGITSSGTTWANLKPSLGTQPSALKNDATFITNLAPSTGYLVKVITDTGFSTEGTYYSSENLGKS